MTDYKLKVFFGYFVFLANLLLIISIVYLTFVYKTFEKEQMYILMMVIAPVLSVYVSMFSSIFSKKKLKSVDKSKFINAPTYIFYGLIIITIFLSLISILYLKFVGYIEEFSTMTTLIGMVEISFGISLGDIVKSLYH